LAGPYTFTPGAISRALIDDYSAEVRPKRKAA
jgi:branched-chain amino acid aminotransferase